MNKEIILEVDEGILLRFNMALQLNGEGFDDMIEKFMKKYIAESFSKEANTYSTMQNHMPQKPSNETVYYGKARNKISKWANRPSQINYKILRAYLQLSAELDIVLYENLKLRCSDEENHSDVYAPTFATNFAQMKFDGEKSHGKVFVIDENNVVTLWDYVKDEIMKHKGDFLKLQSTDSGYINRNNQMNTGRTELDGTDHMQKLYTMRCLNENCGHEYFANGSDIFQKKCPKCQGGMDTGYVRNQSR